MKIKKIISFFLIAVMIFSMTCSMSGCASKESAPESAADAVENMKIGWNLGNSLDATGDYIIPERGDSVEAFETAWNNPVTPDTLMKKIKKLGFETVRIPVTWNYHFDDEGNIDEKWMARVKELVDQALAADLYCIINIHHDTGSDGWLRASANNFAKNSDLFAKLWQQIAETFKDYSYKLLFEGFNEMLDENNEWTDPLNSAGSAINKYNQLFVDTVRATGGKNAERNLICNTYAGSYSDKSMNSFKVPTDTTENHIIGEVHFYAPYEFITDEGITWTTPVYEYCDYVQTKVDYAMFNIDRRMIQAKGIPMIIGEFATTNKKELKDRLPYYTRIIEKAKEKGITCIMWDNGHNCDMGHIDRVGDDDDYPELIQAVMEAVNK